jgi:outer membrane protein assembly factor BamD
VIHGRACIFEVLVLALALASPAMSVSGCASSDEGKSITYSLTAKQNYDKGLEELKDENYPEATRFFSFVKQKFPFSKYAVLAELALADTQFVRGAYQEAIDAYKTFARLHPTHEKVEDGYVAYKICECYTQDMPSDWFLVPPSYEKDQTAVRDAFRELSDFLDKYPDSKYVGDVKKLRRDVTSRLIEHEVYVARFYLDTGHSKAAILRLESALQRYPESGREAELLLYLKASVSGDEPEDIRNYHRAHPEFPHESTADQFFDEAQWESYRKLGEHVSDLFVSDWFWQIDLPSSDEGAA